MRRRLLRINQLIKKELGKIFLHEIEFSKGVFATVTRVETSADLIQAKVYISIFPEERRSEVLKILNGQIYNLQQSLNKRLRMRPIPKIEFFEEKKTVEAGEIEAILENLKK